MDAHHDAVTGAKLEDLRATDPDTPGWTALIEVKGYLNGAKVNDVVKITGRPSVAFAAETHRAPETVWHVVNAWRQTDPATREVAIANVNDLQPLTAAGGALIDTRDLFTAWRDVQEGRTTQQEARASLRAARTRWQPSTSASASGPAAEPA